MPTTSQWFYRRGELARGNWETRVDNTLVGWRHTGLRIGVAGNYVVPSDRIERMIVPLDAPNVVVEVDGGTIELAGRNSVFAGPVDIAYLGIGSGATISADGRFAVAEASAEHALPIAVIRASDVPIEIRGAGRSSRQVHNFGTPGALDARNLIVCEVLTPAGNWSSYPPHKHDETVPGHESHLEEIYYFESTVASGARPLGPVDPFGLFSAYSSPGHPISINARVHTGDVALVPHGYHGPAVAAPGYDLYYLNVMAGPDPQRTWAISDDPEHKWVRATWEGQAQDDRLPFGRHLAGREEESQ